LLGVTRGIGTLGPSLSADIDSDNTIPTHGDREGCHAVNDLQLGHPLVHPLSTSEANHLPCVSPLQIPNQVPVWQHTRHSLRPSDPTPAVINHTGLDRDHRQHHQLTSLAIQSRVNSTDGDLPSSPHSKRDMNADGGNREVSCLVAGLYTRCSAFGPVGGYAHVGLGDLATVDCIRFVQYAALP